MMKIDCNDDIKTKISKKSKSEAWFDDWTAAWNWPAKWTAIWQGGMYHELYLIMIWCNGLFLLFLIDDLECTKREFNLNRSKVCEVIFFVGLNRIRILFDDR